MTFNVNDSRVCPYCDSSETIQVENAILKSEEVKCESCGKSYEAFDFLFVHCTTSRSCEINNEDHDFSIPGEFFGSVNRCSKCGMSDILDISEDFPNNTVGEDFNFYAPPFSCSDD